MIIIHSEMASIIRSYYVKAFINVNCEYYQKNISKLREYSDGMFYDGYLWDCYKKPLLKDEQSLMTILESKGSVFIMWDLHSSEKVLLPHGFEFSGNPILGVNNTELQRLLPLLPEDLYFFDDTYLWTVALTHEYLDDDQRYCMLASRCQGDGSPDNIRSA